MPKDVALEIVVDAETTDGDDLTPVVGQWYRYQEPEDDEDDDYKEDENDEDLDEEDEDSAGFEDPGEEENDDENDQDPGEEEYGDYTYSAQNLDEQDPRPLGCITEVGSNYATITFVNGSNSRIHLDVFCACCELERRPEHVIDSQVAVYQRRVSALMGTVEEVTMRLGVAPADQIGSAPSETQALATQGRDLDEYKTALVKAKDKELPDLFNQIRKAHERMAMWMTAKTIPMKALSSGMRGSIDAIESRISSVELYAGLTEDVEQFAKGKPASKGAKLHLMQRRCYMDEECLLRYETGGMVFDGLEEFDEWLARPEHRDRILPFPRCIVAFRVRRERKHREFSGSMSDFIQIMNLEELDEATFLYIRNGDNLYRMKTDLEFGEKLFPDHDRSILSSGEPLWANMFAGTVDDIIPDRRYQEMKAQYPKDLRKWEMAPRDARSLWRPDDPTRRYEAFNDSSVYYDDISAKIAAEIQHYNRIALIIQGLFDRSPVFNPHGKVKLWSVDGFDKAIELVFDSDRALHAGAKPDFQDYFDRLNDKLKDGDVCIGQHLEWTKQEAEKENNRRIGSRHHRGGECCLETFEPYGNPGPGFLAIPTKMTAKYATFEWKRERLTPKKRRWDPDDYPVKFRCERSKLFNLSAYVPGDFRQFFADPRTRAEYLQWAPLLLAAEEFQAGAYKVGGRNRDLLPIKHCHKCGNDYRKASVHECPPEEDDDDD